MLKWIVTGAAVVLVVIAGRYGFVRYTQLHATESGSFSSRVYERNVETKVLGYCRTHAKQRLRGEGNTPEQYEALCKCFARDTFETIRHIPPDELEVALGKQENVTRAQNVIKKCYYQSGLN